jgi:hypothetical protein
LGFLALATVQALGCFIFTRKEKNPLISFVKMFFNPFASIIHATLFLYSTDIAVFSLKRGDYALVRTGE